MHFVILRLWNGLWYSPKVNAQFNEKLGHSWSKLLFLYKWLQTLEHRRLHTLLAQSQGSPTPQSHLPRDKASSTGLVLKWGYCIIISAIVSGSIRVSFSLYWRKPNDVSCASYCNLKSHKKLSKRLHLTICSPAHDAVLHFALTIHTVGLPWQVNRSIDFWHSKSPSWKSDCKIGHKVGSSGKCKNFFSS